MITPQVSNDKLAKKLGVPSLFLKREDLHPLRSHKGRSLPKMIEKYAKAGTREFAISSSGNAGIASAMFVNLYNPEHPDAPLRLKVFVGNRIPDEKRRLLAEQAGANIKIIQSERPLQSFLQAIKDPKTKGLRQSTDEGALEGYAELARELSKISGLEAVFFPTSSGTGVQGLYGGFKKLQASGVISKIPQIHIVQTQSCHPISDALGAKMSAGFLARLEKMMGSKVQPSAADAIVDQIAHRKNAVVAAVNATHGAGWIALNDDIAKAMQMLREENVVATPNGALAIAGLMKAVKLGKKWTGPVVCVICGK